MHCSCNAQGGGATEACKAGSGSTPGRRVYACRTFKAR